MKNAPSRAARVLGHALLAAGVCAFGIIEGHADTGSGSPSRNSAYLISEAPQTGLQAGLRAPAGRSGTDVSWGWRDGVAAFVAVEHPARRWSATPATPAFARSRPEDLRITRIGLRGSFGTLAVEQQWLQRTDTPATAAFHAPLSDRLQHAMPAHTLSWTSPSHAGWSIGAAYAHDNRPWLHGTLREGRMFGAVSYRQGGLSLSGASNGSRDWNLLGSYTEGRNTWRLMLARFEGEDDSILQFGLDHRYSRALTFFAAFHHDDGAELPALRRKQYDVDSGIQSGRGLMTGLRYDF